MKKTLNYDEAKALLLAQVEKKGADHVYERMVTDNGSTVCVNYRYDEQGKRVPDCIVGHVFADIGALGKVGQYSPVYGALFGLQDTLDVEQKAVRLLARAQDNQDAGVPWGEAVRQAIKQVEAPVAPVVPTPA